MNQDTSTAHQGESVERPTIAHVIPFVAWLFIAHFLGDPDGWKYAVRSAVCLGLLFWLRPWQWYPRIEWKNVPLALAVGVGVFVMWVIGETTWLQRVAPGIHALYGKWAVMPLGEMREPLTEFPYSPEQTGWPLTLVRLAGSSLVIGVIEEFFWRGWLYRWMLGRNFLKVDPATRDRFVFVAVALVFGLEHTEWLAGWITGLVYCWLYVRTRDIWAAALAHALTNALLGWYVIQTGAYWYWS